MTRLARALSMIPLLASVTASATPVQKNGPEVFPGKHELTAHMGFQNGLTTFDNGYAGTPGGFKLLIDYGYNLKGMVWLNVGVNLVVSGSCQGPLCAYAANGNTFEPHIGAKLQWTTPIPLVPYAKADATFVLLYNRYCTDNGFAPVGRIAGGANYFLLQNLGVGVEMGFTGGPAIMQGAPPDKCGVSPGTAFYNSYVAFYAALDFSVGGEFIF
ncbi:MAG: hypothetical protein EXR72_18810 [Myxococcales bacterium]|nr:hypothetical protein [Myxococcales bacterium]